MNYLKLTKKKLSVHLIADLVSSDSGDAVSLFMGTTEDSVDYKSSVTLEYEANEVAAVRTMENICEEIRVKWPDIQNIAIYHRDHNYVSFHMMVFIMDSSSRLGLASSKEASIIVGISSPHREDSIEATNWCISNIRKSVPIRKKVLHADSRKENEKVNLRHLVKKLKVEQSTDGSRVSPLSRQVQATCAELDQRISTYVNHSKDRVNINNEKEFHTGGEDSSFTCIRVDATVQRRKDSKSHLRVNRDLSCYQYRDQNNSDYLTKHAPANGIEERLHSIECQLSLTTPVPKNIYSRLKAVEERLLLVESVSPEYIRFWDKIKVPSGVKRKKDTIRVDEINDMIEHPDGLDRCKSYQRTWY